jgi:hypothetical protein
MSCNPHALGNEPQSPRIQRAFAISKRVIAPRLAISPRALRDHALALPKESWWIAAMSTSPFQKAPALPAGIGLAFCIAANEVFFENIESAVESPKELLKSGDLGSTYQGFAEGALDEATANAQLADLAAWRTPKLDADIEKANPKRDAAQLAGAKLDAVSLLAGIELSEAILLVALKREKKLSERVLPYIDVLRALGAFLAEKIENEDTSEEEETASWFGDAT